MSGCRYCASLELLIIDERTFESIPFTFNLQPEKDVWFKIYEAFEISRKRESEVKMTTNGRKTVYF